MLFRTVTYLLILLILAACKKEKGHCFVGMGEVVSETRSLPPFLEVEVAGLVDVELIQSIETKVEVTHGENVLDGITTRVEGDRLFIDEQVRCKWQRDLSKRPKVKVYLAHIDYMLVSSSSDITSQPLVADSLTVEIFDAAGTLSLDVTCERLAVFNHAGAKEIHLSGSSNQAEFYSAGNSPFDASGFKTGLILMSNKGISDMRMHCSGDVYYQIHSSGNIYLNRGAHPLKGEHTGSGMLFYY